MHRFILLCLVAGTNAISLGYNYQPHGQIVGFGGGFATAGNSGSLDTNQNGANQRLDTNQRIGAGLAGGFGGFTGAAVNGASVSLDSTAVAATPNFEDYNKEFYSYTAPEEDLNDSDVTQSIASTLKRNLRVVFIKTPEHQALTNAALQLAKQASEDRTAIYVLNKQADLSDLANRLQTLQSNQAKPEVHFVKYRTPEDAARAQQEIQTQYDALGGPSNGLNEAVAPVLNFASPATGVKNGAQSYTGGSSGAAQPHNAYLPTAHRL